MGPSPQREETQGSPRLRARRVIAGDAAAPARRCRADVVASYDLGVDCYEQLWSPVVLPAAAALIPWLALAGRSTVLDAGAGTGALVNAIRSAAPTVRVIALDASPQMLRVAHAERGVPAVQADAMALPVAAEAVHAVILAYVLFHLPDPLAALKEARVVRPGRLLPVRAPAGSASASSTPMPAPSCWPVSGPSSRNSRPTTTCGRARSFAPWGASPAPAEASLRWQPGRAPGDGASAKSKRPTACPQVVTGLSGQGGD